MHVTHDVGIGCICTVRCDYVALLASVIRLCKMFGLFWITLCWIVSDGLSVCAIRQHVDTSATSPYSSAFCNIYLYLCICTCIHIYAFVFVYLYLCIVSSAIRQAVYTSALGTLSVLICILLKYKYKSKYKLKRVSVNTNTHQPSCYFQRSWEKLPEVRSVHLLSALICFIYFLHPLNMLLLHFGWSGFPIFTTLLTITRLFKYHPTLHFSYVSFLLKGWNGTRSE